MCITFLAIPEALPIAGRYSLVLLNNRDEDFARRTSPLAWENGILGGRDEQADERGTWLGIDERGRIGNLLSITQPNHSLKKGVPSRGRLVNDFLAANVSAADFLGELAPKSEQFNGFQMLALDRVDNKFELYSLTNKLTTTGPIHWPKGIYCFGNSPRSIPFRKVVYGEQKFRKLLDKFNGKTDGEFKEYELVKALLQLASDRTVNFPDEQIRQQTGAPESSDLHKCLCSIFVDGHYPPGREYGTKSTSIILVDTDGNVSFHERRVVDKAAAMVAPGKWQFSVERFRLRKK